MIDGVCDSLIGFVPNTDGFYVSDFLKKIGVNPISSDVYMFITSLRLYVHGKITGTVPDGFSIAFPKLKNLDISRNAIQGRSLDISGMKSITYPNISINLFEGYVMGAFEAPLEVIDLSRNQFHGHISQVKANSSFNWSHLVYLNLSENQLSGESFHDLNDAHNLKHLNLAHNRFSQQEFPEISKLPSLKYLNLSRTSLIGKIPTRISYLTSLSTLDLSENHLTSRIPDLNVKNLHVLDLSLNNLTGQVPIPLLENLHQMHKFNFSFNNLIFCASQITLETFQAAFVGS
ncbi:hypothetical protein GIB67_008388 [Kingdonia uniflora]|uniref:Uncharacterized protein n=1 Tax=Kingdonia uniflora TaxID=39325 RepID=A0A7J7N4Y7_9MAGN|nr:hypothetical protein GIB67_008388 [Kingdonia uniflora]